MFVKLTGALVFFKGWLATAAIFELKLQRSSRGFLSCNSGSFIKVHSDVHVPGLTETNPHSGSNPDFVKYFSTISISWLQRSWSVEGGPALASRSWKQTPLYVAEGSTHTWQREGLWAWRELFCLAINLIVTCFYKISLLERVLRGETLRRLLLPWNLVAFTRWVILLSRQKHGGGPTCPCSCL